MRQRHSCYVQRMLQSELDTSKTKFKKHEKKIKTRWTLNLKYIVFNFSKKVIVLSELIFRSENTIDFFLQKLVFQIWGPTCFLKKFLEGGGGKFLFLIFA